MHSPPIPPRRIVPDRNHRLPAALTPLILLFLSLASGSFERVHAVPNCNQGQSLCVPAPGCLAYAQFRGDCSLGTREYKCVWVPGPSCSGGEGTWQPCNCSGTGCDCLLEGAPITMADGSTKPVEDIRVGDLVLSWDEVRDALMPAEVVKVHAPYVVHSYYVINGNLEATENHPILRGGEWVSAADLEVGDLLGSAASISSVVETLDRVESKSGVSVYNFQVSLGTYVAGGFVVHNKEDCEEYMQYCGTCSGP